MSLHTFSFNQRNPLLYSIQTVVKEDIIQHEYSLLILEDIASNPSNTLLIDFYYSQYSLEKEAQICQQILEISKNYNTHIFIISPAFKGEPILQFIHGKFRVIAHYLSERLLFELRTALQTKKSTNKTD